MQNFLNCNVYYEAPSCHKAKCILDVLSRCGCYEPREHDVGSLARRKINKKMLYTYLHYIKNTYSVHNHAWKLRNV